MIVNYGSYDEFLVAAQNPGNRQSGSSWAGGSMSDAIDYAKNGNDSLVAQAETLLGELDAITEGELLKAWSPSPMGAYPIVPEYLAGHPLCMRSKSETEERSPVNIYVCLTSSAAIGADTLSKRGTAIFALVLKLQQIRPVNVFALAELEGHLDESGDFYQVIPIQSNPISLAHACNALAQTAFDRQLCHGIAYRTAKYTGCWPATYCKLKHNPEQYERHMREILGMSDSDLYIKCAHYSDVLVNNPVEWINAQLTRFSGIEAE